MLKLQEYRLTDWARRAGLISESRALDKRLNETIVQAMLQELQNLLIDTDKLKSRYLVESYPTMFAETFCSRPSSFRAGTTSLSDYGGPL